MPVYLSDLVCPECGKNIKADLSEQHAFCMYCGSKIDTGKPTVGEEERMRNISRKANGGDVSAQYEMGTAYRTGKGVRQSYAQAMEWYLRAAEQGDPFAMYNIGQMYSCGLGVKQNCAVAASWYAKANEHGINDRLRKR